MRKAKADLTVVAFIVVRTAATAAGAATPAEVDTFGSNPGDLRSWLRAGLAAGGAPAAAEVAGAVGPYYTQGLPEDTQALRYEVLTRDAFLEQAQGCADDFTGRTIAALADLFGNEALEMLAKRNTGVFGHGLDLLA